MPWKDFIRRWTRLLLATPASLVGPKADCRHQLSSLEKAHQTRRAHRVAARFWVVFLDGPRTGALTADLSLEGCRVEGDFRSFVGTEVRLCLELHDAPEPLHLKGRVVWAGQEHSGIQFLNLHVFDEVRLLRALGQVSAVPPSTYLPASPGSGKVYDYTLTPVSEKGYRLEIEALNWCFRIDFEKATVIGPPRGAFQQFQLQDSSPPLQRLRVGQRISLERPRKFLHLLLKSTEGDTVLDVVGEEVGFERQARSRGSILEVV